MKTNLIQHEIQLVNKGMVVEPERIRELYKYSVINFWRHKRYRIFVKNYKSKIGSL